MNSKADLGSDNDKIQAMLCAPGDQLTPPDAKRHLMVEVGQSTSPASLGRRTEELIPGQVRPASEKQAMTRVEQRVEKTNYGASITE